MVPSSRGSAGVFALVTATALLLFGAWFAFGAKDPQTEEMLSRLEGARGAGPDGPGASALADEADVLCRELTERQDTPGISPSVRFVDLREEEVPPPREPPGVTGLEGGFADDAIALAWRASGETPATGYLVEEVGDDGETLSQVRLGPEARKWAGEPVTSLAGSRIYRVTALAGDGTVAEGEQKRVSWRIEDFELTFLGAGPDGHGRFRVVWERAGSRVAEPFAVEPGGEIGDAVPATGNRPELDLSTGWRFERFAGRRETVEREVTVPRFSPNGSVRKDPDSGDVVTTSRTALVPRVEIGAEVALSGDGAGSPRWLPKALD